VKVVRRLHKKKPFSPLRDGCLSCNAAAREKCR
jgi:hypothetical protein